MTSHSPALDFPSSRTGDRSALWTAPTGFTGFACPAGPLSGEVRLPCSSLELLKVLAPLGVRAFPAMEASPVLCPLLTPVASAWLLNQAYRSAAWQQVSPGKSVDFPCIPAPFAASVFDRMGLRRLLPTRPTSQPRMGFVSLRSQVRLRLPSDPVSRRRPCLRLTVGAINLRNGLPPSSQRPCRAHNRAGCLAATRS